MPGSEQGKRHADGRARSWRGGECDCPPEVLRYEIMDDVKAEPSAALRAPGGEERIEGVTLNVLRHADAIIRERDLDPLRAEAPRLDQDASAKPIG